MKTKQKTKTKTKQTKTKRARSTDLRSTALFFTLQQPSSLKMTAVEMASRTVFPPGPPPPPSVAMIYFGRVWGPHKNSGPFGLKNFLNLPS